MELGAEAVLMNMAIAEAIDAAKMAQSNEARVNEACQSWATFPIRALALNDCFKGAKPMKSIFRPIGTLLMLLAFALPLCAQNPNVAIRLDPNKECVRGALKNLRPTTIAVSYIELWIYDAKTCKRICVTRKVINRRIEPCQTLDFDLCCSNLPSASGYIYYVRVHHSLGVNEEWAFTS